MSELHLWASPALGSEYTCWTMLEYVGVFRVVMRCQVSPGCLIWCYTIIFVANGSKNAVQSEAACPTFSWPIQPKMHPTGQSIPTAMDVATTTTRWEASPLPKILPARTHILFCISHASSRWQETSGCECQVAFLLFKLILGALHDHDPSAFLQPRQRQIGYHGSNAFWKERSNTLTHCFLWCVPKGL